MNATTATTTAPDGTAPADSPALRATGIGVSYGGVRATDDVSITVARGEIVGLIGPNGAGKTTLVDAWCGFVDHDGSVEVGGRDVTGWRAHRRARSGLARTWQSVELVEDLTLAQNCLVAAPHASATHIEATLDRVGLTGEAASHPGQLSLGHRKLAGVARAVVADAAAVLLDEPAAGLDPAETEALAEVVRSLADDGLGVVLIEHDTSLVFRLCSRVVVLVGGRVLTDGPPEQVRADPRVIAAYLGTQT
ncbi:MAG: ATP-binding cassette domain-containing protein [Microthrixaceae bacterium]|nr:ATP-binding cassette domain-containing protein [Microthrixaceae bacterium]